MKEQLTSADYLCHRINSKHARECVRTCICSTAITNYTQKPLGALADAVDFLCVPVVQTLHNECNIAPLHTPR